MPTAPGIQKGDRVLMTNSAGSVEVEVVSLPRTPLGMATVRWPNGYELSAPLSDLHAIIREEEGIPLDGHSDPRVWGIRGCCVRLWEQRGRRQVTVFTPTACGDVIRPKRKRGEASRNK